MGAIVMTRLQAIEILAALIKTETNRWSMKKSTRLSNREYRALNLIVGFACRYTKYTRRKTP